MLCSIDIRVGAGLEFASPQELLDHFPSPGLAELAAITAAALDATALRAGTEFIDYLEIIGHHETGPVNNQITADAGKVQVTAGRVSVDSNYSSQQARQVTGLGNVRLITEVSRFLHAQKLDRDLPLVVHGLFYLVGNLFGSQPVPDLGLLTPVRQAVRVLRLCPHGIALPRGYLAEAALERFAVPSRCDIKDNGILTYLEITDTEFESWLCWHYLFPLLDTIYAFFALGLRDVAFL